MKNKYIDANVNHLQNTLIKMAKESSAILEAGAHGDEDKVRIGVDRIRQLSSDIQTIEQKHIIQFDNRSNSEKAEIALILSEYEKCTEFVKAWTQRYKTIGPIPALLQLPDGPGGVLDMILPLAWDWNIDIIAFHHTTDKRLIESMLMRGQKQVCIYGATIDGAIWLNKEIIKLKTEDDVNRYFANVKSPSRILIYEKIIGFIDGIGTSNLLEEENLIDSIHQAFQRTLLNRNTVHLFGSRWIKQAIENLPIIASQPSFKHMAQHISGLPLVIVSPGPSLDKNIHQLKQIQDYAIIVAPAQSAIAMQRENIFPDIVMVADPSDLRYLVDGFDMTKVQALLIGVSCHPSLYYEYKDKVITFNVNGPIDSWISILLDETIPTGACGSVSTNAFMLGCLMQNNPIILVGQDLSFSGSKQYSSNTTDGGTEIIFNEVNNTFKYTNMPKEALELWAELGISTNGGFTSTLPGYFGGVVTTKPDYAIFHGEFERMAASISEVNPQIKLFNCTEGGAFINGFMHIPLKQTIDEYFINENLKIEKYNIFKSIFDSVEKKDRHRKLISALNAISQALSKSIILAKRCHALAAKGEKGHNVIAELSIIEKKLMREIKSSNFVSITVQEEIKNALKLSGNSNNLKQNLGASKILYKIIETQGETMIPIIERSSCQLKNINFD